MIIVVFKIILEYIIVFEVILSIVLNIRVLVFIVKREMISFGFEIFIVNYNYFDYN